LGVTMTA